MEDRHLKEEVNAREPWELLMQSGQDRGEGSETTNHTVDQILLEFGELLQETVPIPEWSTEEMERKWNSILSRRPFPPKEVGDPATSSTQGEAVPTPQPFTGLDDAEDLAECDDRQGMESKRPHSPASTIVIITALPVEYAAVRTHITDWEELGHENGARVEYGQLEGTPWKVALAELGQGAINAAALTEQIVSWLRPQAVLFVGVAGALKDDIERGDVVVGTKVYGIHDKESPEGLHIRSETWHSSYALVQAARSAVRDLADVRAHFKPIATDDVVLADARSAIALHLREHYNDASAIEMEGSGASHAAHLNGQLDALVIRGISDRANASKGDDASRSQEQAAAQAASVAMAVLRKYWPRHDFEKGSHLRWEGAAKYDGDNIDFHGGTFHGPVPCATATLPTRTVGFTGRDEELARLLSWLDPSTSGGPQAVLVSAVFGLGGIGKTTLAVEAAHAARANGWFPGGALFVDLRGYDETPATADQALQSLLPTFGVEPEHIPATAEERAALYLSVLDEQAADRGPVLILLDNVSSPDQVRPLLPGNSGHRLLVTARDRLPQLGARLVPLDQLTPQSALGLLNLALRVADPHDSRVTDDVDGAERLAALCGHLPLALQIAAGLLARSRDITVSDFVDDLTESIDRLGHLNDSERSVRGAFDLSYRQLPAAQGRLLRLLALAPGLDASDEVVAALLGADAPPAQDLKSLVRAHLVEHGNGRGRWRLHDLVRAFGAEVVASDASFREEGEAARERVLELYHRVGVCGR